ncbi:MAG TPA: signal peptidase I [Acidimicrobiales bacterium]|nr:signal peptidase I [Acidimicrobiales bacterium]
MSDLEVETPPSATPEPPPPRRHHWAVGWLVVIIVALVVSVLLRLFVVQTFYVPTASMYPTLQIGDRILVQKFDFSLPRGAIVVFEHPKDDPEGPLNEDLVKRVIGLPGETIWSEGNTVYIDGKPLAEPWLPKGTPLGDPITRQTIPAGEYFMMGDNRTDSYDSRHWGPIPRSTIIGRVFLIVWRHGHPVFDIP